MKQRRREFLKQAVAGSIAPGFLRSAPAASPAPETAPVKPLLQPFNYEGVRLLGGPLKQQYDATRDYYFNLADDDILKGFRERAGLPAPGRHLPGWYGGDTHPNGDYPQEWPRFLFSRGDMFNAFGQWLSGMARMSKAQADSAILAKAARLMEEWGKAIAPDGYFYYSRNPIAPHYTYEKTVCGLVDLYEYGGRKEALPVLEKITGWAARNLDRRRVNPTPEAGAGEGGCEWYTLCENLYRAYQLTGNSTYKTFGDLWRYHRYWGMFSGDAEPAPYHLHAYSHCNTLSSAAQTYIVTGDQQYLKTIVNAHDWFQKTQCYATGGYGPNENLLPPDGSLGRSLETAASTFETPCGSWACFKLTRYLISLTGEARYGDWTERILYSGIGAALPMAENGKTFYYADYRLGGARKGYYQAAFPCCSGTYIQAVADYHNIIYYKDDQDLYVNLFVPSSVLWNRDGTEVRVEQETAYPQTDTTTLTVRPGGPAAFGIRFRVPGWARQVSAEVNGKPVESAARPGAWALVRRTWQPGDRLTIRIPLECRLAPIDPQHPRRVALVRGPLVLVRREEKLHLPGDLSSWLAAHAGSSVLIASGQSQFAFEPFYRLKLGEPYTMYFDLES